VKAPICFLLALALSVSAATVGQINLWPGDAPGEKSLAEPEIDKTAAKDGLVAGKPVIRLGNVSTPTLLVYKPTAAKDTGAAVVVFPGGGYSILAMDLEGSEVCEWLNSLGVTAVLVKYRVPARTNRYLPPLQDAQRAVSITRNRAKAWGIDPHRVGVMGFSAGGHLAANISNNFETRAYDPIDEADRENIRPDFAMLIYPAYLTEKNQGDKIASEITISAHTPPTFLVQAEDDGVRVENSLFYYLALKNAKVPAEMHLYSVGGHGYGLRPTGKPIASWPSRAAEWLEAQGILKRK
jgi:acetyl esterase/lipase